MYVNNYLNKLMETTSLIYDTTMLRGLKKNLSNVRHTVLTIAQLSSSHRVISNTEKDVFAIVGDIEEVAPFDHPYMDEGNVFIDARAYVGKDNKIKPGGGFPFLLSRAGLEKVWFENQEMYIPFSHYIVDAWATWISSALGNRLLLSGEVVQDVKVLCAIYYLGIIHGGKTGRLSPEEVEVQLMRSVPAAIGIPASYLDERILSVFTETVFGLYTAGSHRLEKLLAGISAIINDDVEVTPAVLFGSIQGISNGQQGSNMMGAISIEHPPTFVAMMFLVLENSTYGRSVLGRIITTRRNKHDYRALVKFIEWSRVKMNTE